MPITHTSLLTQTTGDLLVVESLQSLKKMAMGHGSKSLILVVGQFTMFHPNTCYIAHRKMFHGLDCLSDCPNMSETACDLINDFNFTNI